MQLPVAGGYVFDIGECDGFHFDDAGLVSFSPFYEKEFEGGMVGVAGYGRGRPPGGFAVDVCLFKLFFVS